MNNVLHDISWVIPYRNEFLTPFFEIFTWLGYSNFIMILLALCYWLLNENASKRLVVVVMLSVVLNAFLKDLWQNPRPDVLFRLDPGTGKSFGMPSGHAQVSATLWLWLAYEIKNQWAWFVAGFVVACIAFSRIYLGMHDLEDILAGLGLAAATMFVFRWSLNSALDSFRSLSVWIHCLIILIVQTLVYVSWPGFGHSIGAISLGGFLIAWLLGAQLNTNYIKFTIREEIWAVAIMSLLGVIGLILLTSTIKPILVTNFNPIIAGYLRASIAAFYMTAIAPFIFKTIGLGQKANP